MQILFQGTIEYNGQDIAFVVNKTDNDQIEISISFVRGSNTNRATFGFNRVTENRWELDCVNTQSDIDIYLEHGPANNRWTLGNNDLSLELILQEENKLTIQRNKKELADISNITIINSQRGGKTNLNLDLDKMLKTIYKKGGIAKKLIVASSCKDFEKTIENQVALQKEKNISQKNVANERKIEEKTVTKGQFISDKSAKYLKICQTNSKNTILTRS